MCGSDEVESSANTGESGSNTSTTSSPDEKILYTRYSKPRISLCDPCITYFFTILLYKHSVFTPNESVYLVVYSLSQVYPQNYQQYFS